ncbi:hypothetical protein BMF94_5440 [Rhodotorula taiwanensis]|uniref:Uncharacterized protein n=1 Tax=Rhodotorula taiwanensis TaxID=741276 RepID=A0A2S5B415_9BASI|nr:hypothetical protein BMF94_5440 [Rhodotorula taiwanensis]
MVAPNSVAENVFGTLGAVFWSVQLVPQIWKSWKRKDTAGLSTFMLFLWFLSGVWLGSYSVTSGLSIPLVIQPQLFCLFSAIAWAQCLHYDSGLGRRSATFLILGCLAVGGGVEAGLIFGTKALQHHGNERLNTATGVLAAILIIAGLLPQYWEVWKYKAVVGISLVFLTIDLLGGVWSLLSLVFSPPPFDPLAAVSYSSVVVLELGIFFLAAVLNPRYYRKERERKLKEEEEVTTVAAPPGENEPKGLLLQEEGESRAQLERKLGAGPLPLPDRLETDATMVEPPPAAAATGAPTHFIEAVSSREQVEREGGFGWMAHEDEDVEQAIGTGLRRIRSSRSGTSALRRGV